MSKSMDEIKTRYQELLASGTTSYKPDMAWLIKEVEQLAREQGSSAELVADVRHALGERDKELAEARAELAKTKKAGSKSLIFAAKIGMEKAAKIAEEFLRKDSNPSSTEPLRIAEAIRSKIAK